MRVSPAVVADIEWATLALTGLIALISLLGAWYSIPWTYVSRQRPTTRAFNYLWVTRALLQVIAACYALSLDLRLQVLWSAKSAIIPGGYNVDVMCRLYIGLSFGLLEPSFLLLVLFACSHMVHKHANEPGSNPNLFIVALTAGLTLPMCAVQVFAALFSRIMSQLRYNEDLMFKFFAASASAQDTMCPGEPDNPNCAVCLFPAFSTLISAAFALMYLLALWAVLGRVARSAINRMLARRIRLLQVCITLFFCASITLRGVTVVNVDPFSLDFVALWLSNVVVCAALVAVVSVVLVWVPVYDGRSAAAQLSEAGAHALFPPLPDAPTELMPLVSYVGPDSYGSKSFFSHDPPSSDYDYSSQGNEDEEETQGLQQQQQQQGLGQQQQQGGGAGSGGGGGGIRGGLRASSGGGGAGEVVAAGPPLMQRQRQQPPLPQQQGLTQPTQQQQQQQQQGALQARLPMQQQQQQVPGPGSTAAAGLLRQGSGAAAAAGAGVQQPAGMVS